LVAWGKPSASGANDDTGKIVRHANQCLGDIVDAIRSKSTLNHNETVTPKCFGELGPRKVFACAAYDSIAHGQNLGKDRRQIISHGGDDI
jgi:hypothetical protein